jgi:hypothetical protein
MVREGPPAGRHYGEKVNRTPMIGQVHRFQGVGPRSQNLSPPVH